MTMDLKSLTEALDEAKWLAQVYGQAAIRGEFSRIFAAHPQLESITWDQYAPYFNDGEPCEFSVHEPRAAVVSGEKIEEPLWWSADYAAREGLTDHLGDAARSELKALWDAMQGPLEDHMKIIFTEDGTITAKRDGGFEIADCSHD